MIYKYNNRHNYFIRWAFDSRTAEWAYSTMTWRPIPYPSGTTGDKLAALRKHSTPIIDSGMSEYQARRIYDESDAESVAIVRDWFIIPNDFDHFEWPPVPDYSIVKPFKLFVGGLLEDRKTRHLGDVYITTYLRFFVNNSVFITANSTYLLVGEGAIVNDYGAVLRD